MNQDGDIAPSHFISLYHIYHFIQRKLKLLAIQFVKLLMKRIKLLTRNNILTFLLNLSIFNYGYNEF